MWRSLEIGIALALISGCGEVVDPPNSTDSAKNDSAKTTSTLVASAIYDSLGSYTVIPLGTPPIAGVVQVTDINDSNVVIGSISTSTPQAFQWRNGTYELLAHPEPSASFATAINLRGDIVGVTSANNMYGIDSTRVAVVWNAGQKEPVALSLPPSTPPHYAVPVGISAEGAILVRGTYPDVTLVLAPSTRAVMVRNIITPVGMNAAGDIIGRDDSVLYPTMVFMDRGGTRRCTWGSHGANNIYALNDSGDVVVHLTSTAGPPPEATVVGRTLGSCSNYALTPGYDFTGSDLILRAINNRRWVAGKIRGYQGVMILGVNGFASLDSVLRASGPASAAWQVNSVLKINNAGVILARMNGPGATDVPALLIPTKPH